MTPVTPLLMRFSIVYRGNNLFLVFLMGIIFVQNPTVGLSIESYSLVTTD